MSKLKLKSCLNEDTMTLLNGIKTFKDGPAVARDWDGKPLYEMDDEGKPVIDKDEKPIKKKLLLQTDDDENKGVTKEMKKAFKEAVGDFNKYAESVYRDANLKEVCKEILQIGKLAEQIALEETDDWSDVATVQKDFKNLNEACKLFEKTAKDVTILQKRLEGCFEQIGHALNKYYEIKDIENK